MVEITDQSSLPSYLAMRSRLESLRELDVRIAVDAVRCEATNLMRILDIAPDIIKLGVDFTAALVRRPARRGYATGLLRQCQRNGAFVVAVGVEHEDELSILRRLGVDAVQGHLFGTPRGIETTGPKPVLPSSPNW